MWRICVGSAAAIFFLLTLISENIPASATETSLDWIDRATLATGMEQGWGVFAPVPASLEVQTYAVGTFANGDEVRWEPPSGNIIYGSARFERWRKWSTRVRTKDSAHNWETNALRIAQDIEATHGETPSTVRMYRRWSVAPAPGEGFDREYSEFMFYEYDPSTGLGTETQTASSEGVVLDLDADLPPLEDIPALGAEGPQGELPSPEDPPAKIAPPEPLDPAESTTGQLEPIDKEVDPPPKAVVLGLDDELPPLDELPPIGGQDDP